MLDHHQRDAARGDCLERLVQRLGLGGIETGGRLVEQQHARRGEQGAHQLDSFLDPVRQSARHLARIALQPRGGERCTRFLAPAIGPAEADRLQQGADARCSRVLRDHHVLEHREVRHQPNVLEGARQAATNAQARRQRGDVGSLQHDAAGIGRIHAGDQVEHGGLAGAVRADEREALAARHAEGELVDDL